MNERLKKALAAQKRITEIGFKIVKTDPWVPMVIGGQEYKYELSYGATLDVFRATGLLVGLNQITPSELAKPEIFAAMLLAGLRTHHEDEFPDDEATLNKLLRRIPMKHYNYYTTVMHTAMQATEPDIEEISEITDSLNSDAEDQAPLDLQPESTSNGSGPVVHFTE